MKIKEELAGKNGIHFIIDRFSGKCKKAIHFITSKTQNTCKNTCTSNM